MIIIHVQSKIHCTEYQLNVVMWFATLNTVFKRCIGNIIDTKLNISFHIGSKLVKSFCKLLYRRFIKNQQKYAQLIQLIQGHGEMRTQKVREKNRSRCSLHYIAQPKNKQRKNTHTHTYTKLHK